MHTDLSNGILSVRINTLGAEMKSLKLKGKEYLWPGNPDSWKDSSPQLFPVIGEMPPAGWVWKGQPLKMGNHGFARNSLFEVVKKDDREASFRLRDSEETLRQFPFSFILDITYTLKENSLIVRYRVTNPSEEDLLFSLGAHPGFLCPLEEELEFSDYFLLFGKKETLSRRMKETFLTGERIPVLQDQNRLDLDYSLFDKGALIFSGLQSDTVELRTDKSDRFVHMDFSGFPDFGIWTISGKNAPYLCLEPWFGVDSSEGDSPDFEEKEGLIRLGGREEFNCHYTVRLN